MDNRKYRRIASGTQIHFQAAHSDAASREYYTGLVENYSFGGLFLVTSASLSPGDVVDLSIHVPGEPPVQARALVRWTRRWTQPRGAGVEFIDFDSLGDRDVGEFLQRVFETDEEKAADESS